MKSKSTKLVSSPHRPWNEPPDEIVVEFTEDGWNLVRDTRTPDGWRSAGYLHVEEGVSAEEITDAVRDQMIRYFFNHPTGLPGIGATPQRQYWQRLSTEDLERIGNAGEKAYYA